MTIIELCGVPGCGKSSALAECKKKYPELFAGIKGWSDLYPKSKLLRVIIKLSVRLRLSLGILNESEKALWLSVKNPEKNCRRYAAVALALYGRMKKCSSRDGVYLLDEGLVQQLSSSSFEHKLPFFSADGGRSPGEKSGTAAEGGNALSENGTGLLAGIDYIAVHFSCNLDECVKRVQNRGRRDRYGMSAGRMRQVLETKDENLRYLMGVLGVRTAEVSSGGTIEDNAEEIGRVLKRYEEH